MAIHTDELKSAWAAFQTANPHVRIRDAAVALGVSEAELVATQCGETATRLRPDWYEMLFDFEDLGEVMALTRNDVFVHEKVGLYRNPSIVKDHQMGQTLDENIDLRIFFRNWHFAFASQVEVDNRTKRSLQFFDAYGSAVHKLHLRPESNVQHFDAIVRKYRHDEQAQTLNVSPMPAPKEELPDDQIDQQALKEEWAALKDTHQFIFLLRKFNVSREQAFRIAGEEYARPVDTESLQRVLEASAKASLSLMIFVRNPGCVQIHSGPVHRLKKTNDWYNVLDPGFNLHVKYKEIASSWIVKKPVETGEVHSLECFNASGDALCYIFSKRKEGQFEMDAWREILKNTH